MNTIQQVKHARKRKGLNQPKAAVEIGISVFTLRQFEMGGKVSEKTLEKIMSWLKANLDVK